jgi:hypothetical protein
MSEDTTISKIKYLEQGVFSTTTYDTDQVLNTVPP